MNSIELKVGDVLFASSSYRLAKVKVTKITPTQIVLDEKIRLKKPFKDGMSAIGTSGYGNSYYYLPDDELKAQYTRNYNERLIGTFAWSKATNEQVQKVVDLIKTFNS